MSDRSLIPYNANSTIGSAASPYAEAHAVEVYENGVRVAKIASPTFTGTPAAPTATTGTDTTQLATTAFVQQELGTLGALASKNTVGTADITDAAVTLAKLANLAQDRMIGRITAGSGVPEALTPTQVRTMINVEDGASADQTGAEIVSAINTELGSTGWQSSGGASDLGDLGDVAITAVGDGEFLQYSSGSGEWINRTFAEAGFSTVATTGAYADLSGTPSLATVATTGAYSDLTGKPSLVTDLDGLSDVTVAAPTGNELFGYDGTGGTWKNDSAANWGLATTGDLHAAVTLSGTLTDVLSLSTQAIGAVDAGADMIPFWDDSASKLTYATIGTGLTMTGTTLTASSSAPALADVTDVVITAPADNEVLAYDTGSGNWINQTAAEAGLEVAGTATTEVNTHALLTSTHGVAGNLVGTDDSQTLTNKVINGASNTLTVRLGSDVTGDLPLANLAQASAASRLLGRGSASGAGDFQEISLGTGLSMSGTTLSASASAPALNDVTDVTITTVATGEVLVYTGAGWENQTLAEADIAAASDFSNVENTALSTWSGSSNITTVGTIATGTWQATAIGDSYISSAATWNAKQDALTFGIADNNAVEIDQAGGAAANDFARFTAAGIEGRSYAETKADLSLDNVENTALSTWSGSTNLTTLGTGAVDAITEIDSTIRSSSGTVLATETYVDTRPVYLQAALTANGAAIATGTNVAFVRVPVAGSITAMVIDCDPNNEPSAAAVQVDGNVVNRTTGASTSFLTAVASIATSANTGTGTIKSDGTEDVSAGDLLSFDIDQGSDGKDLIVTLTLTPS